MPVAVVRTAGAPVAREPFRAARIAAAAAYAQAATAADAVHPACLASSDAPARTWRVVVVALRRYPVAAALASFPLPESPPSLLLQAVEPAVAPCAAV